MKVAKPDFFYGDRYKLDDWLNQILLYFTLENVKEEKRALTAASQFTAKFTEYAAKTGWDDKALRTMYYRGLKDNVKDELMRYGGDQSTLSLLQRAAIDVDDKLYERSMEKRHNHQSYGRSGYATNGWTGGQQRRDPDAMEIDNTQQRPTRREKGGRYKKGNNQAQGKKREGLKCYNCQKTGHYARDCRGRKVQPQQRRADTQSYEVNVMTKTENESPIETTRDEHDTKTQEAQHRMLHWTACYQDSCTTHWSAKDCAGYFPSPPRKQRQEFNVIERSGWDNIYDDLPCDDDVSVLRLSPPQQDRDDGYDARGRSPPPLSIGGTTLHEYQEDSSEEESNQEPNQMVSASQPDNHEPMTRAEDLGVIPEIDDSDALNESTPAESEDEYSDDEAPDDNEVLHFSVDGPEPIRRMVLHLARRFEEVFPKIQGKRRLNPYEFDQTLAQLRAMFWAYRRISNKEYSPRYVQEVVPMGSTFNPTGGYITPVGIAISRQMRERVHLLAQRYREIEQIQEQWQENEITDLEMRTQCTQHMQQWSIPPLLPPGGPPMTWMGMIFQRIRTTTKGQVNIMQTNGKAVIRPKGGPLSWEVCLEDYTTITPESKN